MFSCEKLSPVQLVITYNESIIIDMRTINKSLIFIAAVLVVLILVLLANVRQGVVNTYDDCIKEHQGALPLEEAWEVYYEECK